MCVCVALLARRNNLLRPQNELKFYQVASSLQHILILFCCRIWLALAGMLPAPAAVVAQESPPLLDSWYDFWFVRFLVNALGYSTIIVPGYLLICYFKRINYLETGRWDSDELGRHLGLLGLMFTCWIFFLWPLFQAAGCASPSSRPACLAAMPKRGCWMTSRLHLGTRATRAHPSDTTPSWLFVLLASRWRTLKHITRLKSSSLKTMSVKTCCVLQNTTNYSKIERIFQFAMQHFNTLHPTNWCQLPP